MPHASTSAELNEVSVAPPAPEASTPATLPTFNSPADVQAAIAAGKLQSGDKFQTPDGRTKVVQ